MANIPACRTIIDTPVVGDSRFKRWTKTVTAVDVSKRNGYAFEGQFIRDKQELEVGTFILAWGQIGSRANHRPLVRLGRVTSEGLEIVYEKGELSEHWTLDVRDDIAELVNGQAKPQSQPDTSEAIVSLAQQFARMEPPRCPSCDEPLTEIFGSDNYVITWEEGKWEKREEPRKLVCGKCYEELGEDEIADIMRAVGLL